MNFWATFGVTVGVIWAVTSIIAGIVSRPY